MPIGFSAYLLKDHENFAEVVQDGNTRGQIGAYLSLYALFRTGEELSQLVQIQNKTSDKKTLGAISMGALAIALSYQNPLLSKAMGEVLKQFSNLSK